MDPLTYALEDGVAVIRMDDGKANALSPEMLSGLLRALDRAEKEAQSIVLTGKKDRFCAGFDLKIMMSGPENATVLLRQGADVLMRLYGIGMPLVIASTGHAVAAGALLLLTGDVRIGATGSHRIGLNEVSIGLPVPILAMELARDRLHTTELARATLGAHVYSPDEACAAGYLDLVVPTERLHDTAKAEASRLGAHSKTAYAATKSRLRNKTIHHIRTTFEEDMTNLLPPSG